jgi:hypothetical protein
VARGSVNLSPAHRVTFQLEFAAKGSELRTKPADVAHGAALYGLFRETRNRARIPDTKREDNKRGQEECAAST